MSLSENVFKLKISSDSKRVVEKRCEFCMGKYRSVNKYSNMMFRKRINGVAIYEPYVNKEYNEYSEVRGYNFISKMCIDWEKAASLDENSCRQVNIRIGAVLGRDGGMIKSLYMPFLFGLGGPVLPGTQNVPWIHIRDLCRLFLFCIENEKVNGILNGVSPQIITYEDFSNAFAKSLNRPNFIPVPEFVLKFMFGIDRASMLTRGPLVHPKRAIDMGFTCEYSSIEETCQEIIQNSTE